MSQRGCAGRQSNQPASSPAPGRAGPAWLQPGTAPIGAGMPGSRARGTDSASPLHCSSLLPAREQHPHPQPLSASSVPAGGQGPPCDASRLHRGAAAPSRVPERMETRRGTGSCGINPRTCQPPRGHEPRQISALHCAKTSVAPLHLLGGGRSEDLHRPGCSSTQLGLAARHGVARKLGITASCLDVGLGAMRLPGVVGTGPAWSVYGFGDVGGTRGCVHGCVRVVVREATRRQREL